MEILKRWVDERYLTDSKVQALIESAQAKPAERYLVLDDFLRIDAIERLIGHCSTLQFSDDDRISGGVARRLPYDSAVKFANASDVGWDLFNAPEWHEFCARLVGVTLSDQRRNMVKLRYHRPDATGFWIHTDAIPGDRSIAVIAYFNPGWRNRDGALLQVWREEDPHGIAVSVEAPDPDRSLDVLRTSNRIRTRTPGGGKVREVRDFTLIDQIVPEYNRLVICNLQTSPVWHSVTPSNGRPRYGFVQWIA